MVSLIVLVAVVFAAGAAVGAKSASTVNAEVAKLKAKVDELIAKIK
jgi:hypothetical protein